MARIELDLAGAAGIKNGIGTSLGDTRVEVIVPDTASAAAPRTFPVLWLLHDYGGNHSDWLRYTNIEVYAKKKDVIIVCPSGENSYYVDIGYGWTGTSDATYITENLRNIIFAMFPASREAKDNYVAGVGMGGYGAMHLLRLKPDYFGTAISVHGDLDAPERYVKGTFPHPYGDEIFGDPGQVAGSVKDLYTLEAGLLTGKQVILAAAETDGAADRFAEAAKNAGASVRLDRIKEENGKANMDGFAKYILGCIG